jgi:hypothetical protein
VISGSPTVVEDASLTAAPLLSVELSSTAGLRSGESNPGGESGVYIVERNDERSREQESEAKKMSQLLEHVTLVVYGWKNVEPGTLSWVFPSVGAAVAAARAMKNAVKWAIVAGRRDSQASQEEDLDAARAHGAVLIEQAGG